MREQTRVKMDPVIARKAESIPNRHVFMMGNGQPLPPKRAKKFCNAIVDRCLEDRVREHYDFVLGFAACFDAISRGTIDLEEHPINVALQAYSDVHNISNAPNEVTNIMKEIAE